MKSWRTTVWCWKSSSDAHTQLFPTLQVWLKLTTSVIWPQCLKHRLKCVTISEAEVVQNGTSNDLHCKSRLHFQSFEKYRSLLGLHNVKCSFDDRMGLCIVPVESCCHYNSLQVVMSLQVYVQSLDIQRAIFKNSGIQKLTLVVTHCLHLHRIKQFPVEIELSIGTWGLDSYMTAINAAHNLGECCRSS